MEEKFIELFKETLELEDTKITMSTVFRDLENWDSLTFLSVLAMIDEEYDVVIGGNNFRELVTIEDLINGIKKNSEG